MTLNDLKPEELERMKTALAARDEVHRSSIVDLLNKTHGIDQISTRLDTKPKSVYELARRFELDVGVRFPWPWRKQRMPGPGLTSLDDDAPAQN